MTRPTHPAAFVARVMAVLVVATWLAACNAIDLGPAVPGGMRRWVIPVDNQSGRPARIEVAVDGPGMGRIVGTVSPNIVPAGATVDVVFGIPAGGGWAVFVNSSPNVGSLISATDVPPAAQGQLPLKIHVAADGSPSVEAPDQPGWFGN